MLDFLLDGLEVREGDLVLEIEVRVEHTGGAAGLVLVVIAGEPPDRLVANWVIPPKGVVAQQKNTMHGCAYSEASGAWSG